MAQVQSPSSGAGIPPALSQAGFEPAKRGAVPYGTYRGQVNACEVGAKEFQGKSSAFFRWWITFGHGTKRYAISILTAQRVSTQAKKRPSLADVFRACGYDPASVTDTDVCIGRDVAITVRDSGDFTEVADIQPATVLQPTPHPSQAVLTGQPVPQAVPQPVAVPLTLPPTPSPPMQPSVPVGTNMTGGQPVPCILCSAQGKSVMFGTTADLSAHMRTEHRV